MIVKRIDSSFFFRPFALYPGHGLTRFPKYLHLALNMVEMNHKDQSENRT